MSFNDSLNPIYLPTIRDTDMNTAEILTFSSYVNPMSQYPNNWDNRAYYSTYEYTNEIFKVSMMEGATYTIFSDSFFDPFILMVYKNDGIPIVANDEDNDYSYGSDIIFDFIAPYSGNYYIDANWNQGTYHKSAYLSIYEDINTIVSNKIPTSSNKTLTINEDTTKTFTLNDFAFNDTDTGDTLQKVKITTLSTAGTLKFNNIAVTLNQEIIPSDIVAGKLTFTPAADANGMYYARIAFKVSDGEDYAIASNTVLINVTAVDEPTLPTFPSTSDTSSFVERLYTNVLGRNSDSDGLANWVDALETSNAANVAKSFFNSQEFLNANYSNSDYVQKLYLIFMDRTYDDSGLTHWVNQLNSGISRDTVLDGFAKSAEFATIAQNYGVEAYGDDSNTQSNSYLSPVENFVERFYTEVLGRPSDTTGLQNWADSLENGSKTADDIAQGFFFSTEFTNQNLSNNDFVDIAYETFLNRAADSGGKSHWLSQLSGGLSRGDMIDGFIYSTEFNTLAQGYGIEVGVQELVLNGVATISSTDDGYNLL